MWTLSTQLYRQTSADPEVSSAAVASETQIYGHQDQRDLERAMEAFADAREAEEATSRGNDSPSRLD
jgi:hypothetical protein